MSFVDVCFQFCPVEGEASTEFDSSSFPRFISLLESTENLRLPHSEEWKGGSLMNKGMVSAPHTGRPPGAWAS